MLSLWFLKIEKYWRGIEPLATIPHGGERKKKREIRRTGGVKKGQH